MPVRMWAALTSLEEPPLRSHFGSAILTVLRSLRICKPNAAVHATPRGEEATLQSSSFSHFVPLAEWCSGDTRSKLSTMKNPDTGVTLLHSTVASGQVVALEWLLAQPGRRPWLGVAQACSCPIRHSATARMPCDDTQPSTRFQGAPRPST